MTQFQRYIGIDYSGAKTPTESLRGLRVYAAKGAEEPSEVMPPPSPRRYWTRQGVAEWLCERLHGAEPTVVGIDHGFSFPVAYFKQHGLGGDWERFLDDFCAHWPTDEEHVYVQFIRDGLCGNGAARTGDSRWLRLTEKRTRTAKSVFRFDVQGSVAKSTHAGIPWLRFIRRKLGSAVHFWPFDGWMPPDGVHVIAEVYPSLWRYRYAAKKGVTADQQDAFVVCRRFQEMDVEKSWPRWFQPSLSKDDLAVAGIEGWILGVE